MSSLRAPLSGSSKVYRKRFEKIFLIDADFLKYYVVSDISKYWESSGDPVEAYGSDYIMHFLEKQMDTNFFSKIDCWSFVFVFSGGRKDTFRYGSAFSKEYKGNRKTPKRSYEKHYEDMASVVSCIARNNPILLFPEYEADDILGAIQNEHTVIYSHDKDMNQVPGLHYDIGRNNVVEVTEEDGYKILCAQMLTGDSADNISGIPGVGPKSIEKIFDTPEKTKDGIHTVFMEYINRFGSLEGVDMFCESWNLLFLRRGRGEWFKKKINKAFVLIDGIINLNKKEND